VPSLFYSKFYYNFTTARPTPSQFVFFCRHLVNAPKHLDSSTSVFTSIPGAASPIVRHGSNSWSLTISDIWPPKVTTRCRVLLLVASDSEIILIGTQNKDCHRTLKSRLLTSENYSSVALASLIVKTCVYSHCLATGVFSV
jgi:hypothetical protein